MGLLALAGLLAIPLGDGLFAGSAQEELFGLLRIGAILRLGGYLGNNLD